MAYKSLAVANAFIKKAVNAGKPPTQMKLQKLVFFAHGWHLAITGTPLIDESFEAWPYGPVAPSVYHEFKAFGRSPITTEGTELSTEGGNIEWVKLELPNDEFLQALINKIWEVYGSFSGTYLSKLTHKDGSPWHEAAKPFGGEPPRDTPIPDGLIKQYFQQKKGEA